MIALLALLAVTLAVAPASAQSTVVLKDPPRCAECISLTRLVTLVGTQANPLSQYTRIIRSGDDFVAGPTHARGQLQVFDASGAPVATFGRPGEGPGEIRGSAFRLTVGPGDSIHIVDSDRWSVFAPRTYRYVRSVRTGATPTSVAVTPDGQFVAGAQHADGTHGTQLVHIIDAATGRIVHSLGATGNSNNVADVRVVHADTFGIWATPTGAISIEVLNRNVRTRFVRTSGWFPPSSYLDPDEPFYKRPTPRVVGMRRVKDVLLIYASVADRNWTSIPKPPAESRERARVTSVSSSQVFDGVMEAIDVTTGQVLSRARVDWVARPLAGSPNLVQRIREQPNGEVAIDILEVRFDHNHK